MTELSPLQKARLKFKPVLPATLAAGITNLSLIEGNATESVADQEQIQKEQQKTIPIIKAFAIATPKDLTETKNFETCCDYFLFDTKSSLPGGNGISFDWNILNDYTGNIPFLVSGGIRPTDIEKILSFQHPACIGIDINSQFEIYPGEKDTEKIKKFIQSLRSVKSNKLPII